MKSSSKRQSRPTTNAKLQRELNRRIKSEAKALGLTQREYLRLTLALSKALRESLGNETDLDPKAVLAFVESPMFSLILSGIAKTAISSVKGDSDSSDSESTTQHQDAEDTRPRTSQQGQQPHYPGHPGRSLNQPPYQGQPPHYPNPSQHLQQPRPSAPNPYTQPWGMPQPMPPLQQRQPSVSDGRPGRQTFYGI